jgi:hypothetical protein
LTTEKDAFRGVRAEKYKRAQSGELKEYNGIQRNSGVVKYVEEDDSGSDSDL